MLPANNKKSIYPTINDFFFGNNLISPVFSDGSDHSVPAVNIRESENSYEVEMAIPGLSKEEIHLKLDKDILTVYSEQKDENEEKTDDYTQREFSYRSFSRSFIVPEMVNTDAISASHENGVLNIALPKIQEEAAPKSKTIKIS